MLVDMCVNMCVDICVDMCVDTPADKPADHFYQTCACVRACVRVVPCRAVPCRGVRGDVDINGGRGQATVLLELLHRVQVLVLLCLPPSKKKDRV